MSAEQGASISACPFCDYKGPSPVLLDYSDVIVFEPLNPVTHGHVLVVPKRHVGSAFWDFGLTARTMECAARWAAMQGKDCNFITSVGRNATQTIAHLHIHVVPRYEGDGLALPWTGQAVA